MAAPKKKVMAKETKAVKKAMAKDMKSDRAKGIKQNSPQDRRIDAKVRAKATKTK